MKLYENGGDDAQLERGRRSFKYQWLAALLAGVAISAALVPRVVPAAVALVVVDVVTVADGYRFSKLRGQTVYNSTNGKIGDLDDLIVGKDRVLFAIIQVGGFLGIGSRLVLPGATKEQVKSLPEFHYR
jgi:hypothetical protein